MGFFYTRKPKNFVLGVPESFSLMAMGSRHETEKTDSPSHTRSSDLFHVILQVISFDFLTISIYYNMRLKYERINDVEEEQVRIRA